MRFTLTIQCDNAAFYDDDRSTESPERLDSPALYDEVSRILRGLRFDASGSGSVFDVNGNKVGKWEFSS